MKATASYLTVLIVLFGAARSEAALTNYYPFDVDASDAVGTNNGLFVGDASIVVDSERGNVLDLDGFGDYVSLPRSNVPAGPTNTTVFSIAAWIKLPSGLEGNLHNGGIYGEYRSGQVGTKNFFLGENGVPGNGVVFGQFPPTGGVIRGDSLVSDGTWHHVAYVQNEPGGFARNIYVDGVLDGFDNAPELYTGPDPNLWTIGARLGVAVSVPRFTQGRYDDVRFYDHALSASEVAALVPEPSAFVLTAIGVLGLVGRRRRRKR